MIRAYIKLVSLLFVVGLSIQPCNAQETYQWVHFNNEKVYRMYKVDFFDLGNIGTLLFEIPDTLFTHSNMSGLDNVIYSFEFTPDRKYVYFLEREGELYLYNIATASLDYLDDVTPQKTPATIHFLQRTYNLIFYNDTILHCFGDAHLTYNLHTNISTIYRRIPSLPMISTLYESSIALLQIFTYKEDTIANPATNSIVRPVFFKPEEREIWITPQPISYTIFDWVAYHFDCDSVALFRRGYDQDIGKHYYMEMDTFGYLRGRNNVEMRPPSFINNNVDVYRIKNYPGFDYKKNCMRIVNLDEDESTRPGPDYRKSGLCKIQDIPIGDGDTRVSNSYPLDSVVISFTTTDFPCYFYVPPGNYDITDRGHTVVLSKRSGTKNSDFEDAIKQSTCTCDILNPGQYIHYGISAWYKGVPGQTAGGSLETLDQYPYAGLDQDFQYCISGDSTIYLNSFITSGGQIGGDFLYQQTLLADDSYKIEPNQTYNIQYVVGGEECADTAIFTITTYEIPQTEDIVDQFLCYGKNYYIDLTHLKGEIEWSDGYIGRTRTIDNTGLYSYSVTGDGGCQNRDDFIIQFSTLPGKQEIELKSCHGEPFFFENNIYFGEGVDTIITHGVTGCDSLQSLLVRKYYPLTYPEWESPESLCEGNTGTLIINNYLKNILINGQPGSANISISAGVYTIEGTDENECLVTWEIDIPSRPYPEVWIKDLTDTVWNPYLIPDVRFGDNIVRYSWMPSSMFDCSECPFPNFKKGSEGNFTLEVINDWGCSSRISGYISYKENRYYLPDVIRLHPQNSTNGLFFLSTESPIQYEMSIFDRWGNKVYTCHQCWSNDVSLAWNPDSSMQQGVYVYLIRIYDAEEIILTGDITLLE